MAITFDPLLKHSEWTKHKSFLAGHTGLGDTLKLLEDAVTKFNTDKFDDFNGKTDPKKGDALIKTVVSTLNTVINKAKEVKAKTKDSKIVPKTTSEYVGKVETQATTLKKTVDDKALKYGQKMAILAGKQVLLDQLKGCSDANTGLSLMKSLGVSDGDRNQIVESGTNTSVCNACRLAGLNGNDFGPLATKQFWKVPFYNKLLTTKTLDDATKMLLKHGVPQGDIDAAGGNGGVTEEGVTKIMSKYSIPSMVSKHLAKVMMP